MAIKSVYKRTKPKYIKPSMKQEEKPSAPRRLTTLEEDVYVNMKSLTLMPISLDYLEGLAREAIAFVEDDERDCLKIEEFLRAKGMNCDSFAGFRKRCPNLEKAVSWMKMVIGIRRERGMLKGSLREAPVLLSLPFYDPNWKEMVMWREQIRAEAKLRAESQTTKQDINIFLNDIPMPKKEEPK